MLTSSAQERFLSVKIDISDSQIVSSKSFAKIAQQRLITKQSEMLLENNLISAITWGQWYGAACVALLVTDFMNLVKHVLVMFFQEKKINR